MPRNSPKATIARCALASALGPTLAQSWEALLAGRHIHDHARVPIGDFEDHDRAMLLARDVGQQLAIERLDPRTPLIVGTSKGPIENWIAGAPAMPLGAAGLQVSGLGEIAARLGHELGLRGPRLTVSAACASGLIALIRGAMMIEAGESDRALVIATESSMHPLFLGTFARLGVLAKAGEPCRPFDRCRSGFLVSEAAAAVLLESTTTREPPEHSIIVNRYAFGGDATHITAADPHMRALSGMLHRVIQSDPFDLIHAHGTATDANDPAELAAIESACDPRHDPPHLYSHKGALGHSLGASGLVSVVLNCTAYRAGVIPPNPTTTDPLPASRVLISAAPARRQVRRSLAIASGFGGPTAVVALGSL